MLAFIGPNGAGKSTTIKLITGILYPTSGSIRVLGLDPHRERKALARRIGTVFGQRSQLWYHLPPLDTMLLLADIYDLERKKARARIDFLVEIFDIKDYLNTPVRKLSLGERVRCEIAASLLHSPEVLFLDEPTIGLDVIVQAVDPRPHPPDERGGADHGVPHLARHGRHREDLPPGHRHQPRPHRLGRDDQGHEVPAAPPQGDRPQARRPAAPGGRRGGGAEEPPVLREARGGPRTCIPRRGRVADHARQPRRGHHDLQPADGGDHHEDLQGGSRGTASPPLAAAEGADGEAPGGPP